MSRRDDVAHGTIAGKTAGCDCEWCAHADQPPSGRRLTDAEREQHRAGILRRARDASNEPPTEGDSTT